MIHKILFHGRNLNPFDYLLHQERLIPAEVIQGDVDLVSEGIKACPCSRKYTSLVLSFEENLDHDQKMEAIRSYEDIAYAGTDDTDILRAWIEHKDKNRTELHGIVVNTHLSSGKRWQHYFDRVDRSLFKSWQELFNMQHGYSSVDDPARERLQSIPGNRLPEKKSRSTRS